MTTGMDWGASPRETESSHRRQWSKNVEPISWQAVARMNGRHSWCHSSFLLMCSKTISGGSHETIAVIFSGAGGTSHLWASRKAAESYPKVTIDAPRECTKTPRRLSSKPHLVVSWMGLPKNGWFIVKIPLKWMMWGYPHFRKPPYHWSMYHLQLI